MPPENMFDTPTPLLIGWPNQRNSRVMKMRLATFCFKAWNLLALSTWNEIFTRTYCALSEKQAEMEQKTAILKSKWRGKAVFKQLHRNSFLCFSDYFGPSNVQLHMVALGPEEKSVQILPSFFFTFFFLLLLPIIYFLH